MRRVQAELQHCWALQMQRKHLKSNQTDAVKWRLRNHMAFLVDNLQYYLQVCADREEGGQREVWDVGRSLVKHWDLRKFTILSIGLFLGGVFEESENK